MFEIKEMIWILPVIFIIHDMEEIIWVKQWVFKNQDKVQESRIRPFAGFCSTESFAFAVFEELLLISAVCLYTSLSDNFLIWYGVMFVVAVHFIPHVVSFIVFKGYVPGAVTGAFLFPLGLYILYNSLQTMDYTSMEIFLSCIICTITFLINLFWLHKMMPEFDKLINK